MDTTVLVEILIIGYLLVTVYLANYEYANGSPGGERISTLLYGAVALIGLLGLYAIFAALVSQQIASMTPQERTDANLIDMPEIGIGWTLFALLVAGIAGYGSILFVRSTQARYWLREKLRERTTYNPDSVVHTTALIFSIFMITVALTSFAIGGGTEGVAEQLDEGVSPSAPLIQGVVQVVVAVLGVGYMIRRDLSQMLNRLGLRLPNREDFNYGFGGGIALYVGAIVFSVILSLFFSAEQIEQQTEAAENLQNAFSTLPLALLLATTAAVGEEVFFRGAIQPVFGLIPTSIFFTLMHSQVLLTPGMIWIFLVSLGFGWIRQQYSTTAAIIAHFIYNMMILLSQIFVQSGGGM